MQTLLYVLAAVGVYAILKGLFSARKPEKAVPAEAPLHASTDLPAQQDADEQLVAAIAAALMLCGPGERIRRITPLSYDEPKKPLLRASYTIEEI